MLKVTLLSKMTAHAIQKRVSPLDLQKYFQAYGVTVDHSYLQNGAVNCTKSMQK